MVEENKDKFVLKLGNDENGQPKTLSAEETLQQMKRGFNNGAITFEYPFLSNQMNVTFSNQEWNHLTTMESGI